MPALGVLSDSLRRGVARAVPGSNTLAVDNLDQCPGPRRGLSEAGLATSFAGNREGPLPRLLRHLLIACAIVGVGAALLYFMIADAVCVGGAC